MAVSLHDLFPLRSGRAAHPAPAAHPLYRKHGRARAAARPSKIGFETLEPRVLLSADGFDGVTLAAYLANPIIGNGVLTELDSGLDLLDNVAGTAQGLSGYADLLATEIPGLLERDTLPGGGAILQAKDFWAPTVADIVSKVGNANVALGNRIANFINGLTPVSGTPASFVAAIDGQSVTAGDGFTITLKVLDVDAGTAGVQKFLLRHVSGDNYEFLFHLEVSVTGADAADTFSLDLGRNADALEIDYAAADRILGANLPPIALKTEFKVETVLGVAATIVESTYDADPGAGVNLQPRTTVTPGSAFVRDAGFFTGVTADVATTPFTALQFGFLDVKANAGTAKFDMHAGAVFNGDAHSVGDLGSLSPSLTTGGAIEVLLPIAVDPSGLGGNGFDGASPVVRLYTTDPFSPVHATVPGSDDGRTAIQIDLQGFDKLNPFRNLDAAGLANVFSGLGTMLAQLQSKAELFGLKLPLVDATKISDALKFDGPMKTLYEALTQEVNGARVARFVNVQDFVGKLQTALNGILATYNTNPDFADIGALVGINPRYLNDVGGKPTLLFDIELHAAPTNDPIDVAGNLGLDLGALGNVAVTGSLALKTGFDLKLTLGIELVEAPNVGIVTAAAPSALIGGVVDGNVANGPVQFSLVLGAQGAVQVSLAANNYGSAAGLATALGNAISTAIAAAVSGNVLPAPALAVSVTANAQGRLVIASTTLPYLQIRMTAGSSAAAFAELGFADGQRASVSRLPADGRLSGNAAFDLTIGSITKAISLSAAATAANADAVALVAQLNAAIAAQFGAGVYATLVGDEVIGRQIRIASGQNFVRVDNTNAVARAELGLADDAESAKLAIRGDASMVAGLNSLADALPVNGNLGNISFTVQLAQGGVNSGVIVVNADVNANNLGATAGLAALAAARDINEALSLTTLTGSQKLGSVLVATAVEFLDAQSHGTGKWGIRFSQPLAPLDTTLAFAFADSITLGGIDAAENFGAANGTAQRSGPSLSTTLGGDAAFTINLTGAGGVVTQQAITIDDGAITNTLQGVVDAINTAIGAGALAGKVVVGLDGSRLVFAVRDPAFTVIELSSINSIARDDLGLQEGISSRTFDGVQAFVQDVHLDASIALDGSASGQANFGFVSLDLGTATAELDASVAVDFGAGERIYVKDIFNALGRPLAGPGGLVDVLEGSGGNGDIVGFGPAEDEEIDLRGSASLKWDGAAISVAGSGGVASDLAGELGEVAAPHIYVTLPDITHLNTLAVDASLGSLADLADFGFDDAIAALRGIAQWLQAYVQKLDIVNEPLPLLGVSLADTLGFVDDFAQAIEDIAANPTKSLQALLDKVNEGLQQFVGPIAHIGYQSNSPGILTFDITFSRQFSDILPIEIDMVDLLKDEVGISVPGLELNGAANLAAKFTVDASLVFGVDVGGLAAILNDPVHTASEVFDNIFLVVADNDAENIDGFTHLELTGYAAADNVTFTGALGPLGLFVTNGGAVLNRDGVLGHTAPASINIELPDVGTPGDGYITLAEFFDGGNAVQIFSPDNVDVNLGVAAVLPVSFPTSSNFIGNLDFSATVTDPFSADGVSYTLNSIPDFSKIDLGNLSILETINLFLAGADTVLGTLGDLITDGVFGSGALSDLPLVGDALKDAGAFIDQIRNEVIPAITNVIETAPELAAGIFQQVGQILQNAIGALGWLDSAVKLQLVDGGVTSTFQFGGGQDFSTLAAKVLAADSFAYVIDLGVDLHIHPKDVNLNLEVFQLELIDPITVDISADLTFGIGVSLDDGFFFQVNPDGVADLSGSIEIKLPASIRAQLFLIELNAVNNNFGSAQPDLEAAFSVDLQGTGSDGRIGFGDITDIGFDIAFGATVDLDFQLDLGVANGAGIGLPKILADFDFAWGFGNVMIGAEHYGVDADHPDKPLLALGNIRLDIGSFLGDTIGPFISDIYDVIEPIDPILDILTNPIPVLSDLLGPTSLLDVAATFGIVNPGLVTALELLDQIVDFAATVADGANGYVTIYAGTLSFGGNSGLDLTDMDQVGALTDPSKALGVVLTSLKDSFGIDVPPELTAVLDFVASGFNPGAIPGMPSALGGATGGFSFPFLEHFEEVLGLFFGRNMTLVSYDLPPLEFGFDFSIYVPIWDGLGARFAGGINAVIDLAFGYDTEGIFRFINGGHNPLDLVQGFFVYDDNPFGGFTGIDVPEVLITGQITAAAELNLVVASAGVGGGIFATVGFDLADPDGDFRVRLDEIIANLVNGFKQGVGPLGLFDVDAKIEAKLFAYIEALFGIWRKEFQFGPSIPLYEEHYVVPHDPVLATDMENGVLRLNVGDFAGDRIYTNNGADTPVDGDEQLEIDIVSQSEIRVRGKGPDFDESGAGDWQTFTSKAPGGFTSILGYAGQGNDKIIVVSDATAGLVKFQVDGGAGDDELQGGNAADLITGGTGADHLRGGAGNDEIDGGAGADCLEGEAGNDKLTGGAGNDVLIGGAGNDLLLGDAGDDVISGGLDNDTALGGDGIDLIAGGGGADVLMGNAGNDRLWGDLDFTFTDCVLNLAADGDEPLFAAPVAEGDDLLSGGGGSDEIQGNGGNDRIWGDSTFKLDAAFVLQLDAGGLPLLLLPEFGNFGADNLSGGAGNDTIYGEAGNDIIRGDNVRVDTEDDNNPFTWVEGDRFSRGTPHGGSDGNDTIYAGRDSDIVYGNGGNDVIAGGTENDILFGNAGNDTITGDTGADVIFGDSGAVQIFVNGDAGANVVGGTYTAATQDFKLLRANAEAGDGDDTIDAGQDNDIVFGGAGLGAQAPIGALGQTIEDLIKAGSGDDIVFGDQGQVSFTYVLAAGAAFATDIFSVDKDQGGDDQIFGSTGRDVLIGGKGGDFVNGDDGPNPDDPDSRDVLAGDHVQMTQVVTLVSITPNAKVADVYVAAPKKIVSTETAVSQAGNDTLDGGQDDDFLIGGPGDDKGTGGTGNDVLLGDRGQIDFDLSFIAPNNPAYVFGKGELFVLQTVRSIDLALVDIPFTGIDRLSGGDGNDVVIGGGRGDFLFGDAPLAGAVGALGANVSDILLGDNGQVDYLQHGKLARVFTTDLLDATGGNDAIEGNAGVDIAMGGVGSDDIWGGDHSTVTAADGADILLGDNGRVDFTLDRTLSLTLAGGTPNLATLDLIESSTDGKGAADTIRGNAGADVAMGGTGGDAIYGDDENAGAGLLDGADMLLGDNGLMLLVDPALDATLVGSDRRVVRGGAVALLRSTDENDAIDLTGGSDVISGNAGGDVILGGVRGDTLYGDRAAPTATTNARDGDDTILGDNGALEWLSTGRLGELPPAVAQGDARWNALIPAAFTSRDTNLDTLDLVTTEQPTKGGRDLIYGDNGRDAVFGGTDADTIYGDTGSETDGIQSTVNGNDLLFGDHGRLYVQFSRLADIHSRNFFAIDIGQADGGEGDRIWGEEGMDILLGQQGDDRLWGGSGDDDLIGGHNVLNGADELNATTINITTGASLWNDVMDGGSGNDTMAGDNSIVWRTGQDTSPRFRTLPGSTLYTTTETTVTANVTAADQRDPDATTGRYVFLLNHDKTANTGLFGNDVMAGGAGRDTMFGQLGNDLMQGDGLIDTTPPGAIVVGKTLTVTDSVPPSTGGTLYFRVPEQASDGDDYMEGNGGSDTMYGGLGQDDMIGGSSSLYGLDPNVKQGSNLRPDSTDWMWGGAGVQTARGDQGYLLRADLSGTDPAGLAAETPIADERGRDADHMLGDNGNIYRIVKTTAGVTAYVRFQYDNTGYTGANPLVVRSMEWLDYTLGGPDFDQNLLAAGIQSTQGGDNGAGDYMHGEAGNDVIHGMAGSDILFGDANDDDITGGYGHDWISGGTGRDGVIGDDGIIRTSRNSTTGEALFGVAGLLATDPSTKDSNGNVLDEVITTPGSIQRAVINVAGELTKAMDLTPLSVDASWMAVDDEFGYAGQSAAGGAPYADDIIYGGLGSDWLHGGSGDDAISGAEALPVFYAAANAGLPGTTTLNGSSVDAGNQLRFNPIDLVSNHTRERAGEFALYDEYNPLRQIRVSTADGWSGDLLATGGNDFILNFNENEGVLRPSETVPTNGNNTIVTGPVYDDGDDRIFGDTGNDWIVGGTGRDDVYGGWGNDLLNVDDDQTTAGGLLNDTPDTHSTYEDRAYGGAGRDVLIANTGGDRLIDWVGEWNSYLVPFAPFGMATVSRTLQPQLQEFLYALSRGDGADPTIVADGNGTALRNGEPYGELGLVLQKDAAWQDQTGAPADPQAGNIPGGKRDVLRSADFNNQQGQGFVPESGSWSITNGKYEIAPSATSANKDAISLYFTGEPVPTYFEVAATINAIKPTGGFKANAYVIFDYVNPDNFKFAGLNVSTNKIEIGQRASWGFQVLKSVNASLKAGQDYNVLLAVNGNAVTFVVDGSTSISYAFAPRVDEQGVNHPIRDGMVGLGGDNARARIDDVRLQILPPTITYAASDGFAPTPTLLAAQTGTWSALNGRFVGTPTAGSVAALSSNEIAVGVAAYLQVDSTFKLLDAGATAGIVFDKYSATDFKWVGIAAGKLMLGHYTAKAGWVVDMTVLRSDAIVGNDVALSIALKGSTVSVTLNGATVASRAYNATLVDGAVGTFARGGSGSFDSFGIKTDDAKMSTAQAVTTTTTGAATTTTTTTASATTTSASTLAAKSADTTLLAAAPLATGTSATTGGTATSSASASTTTSTTTSATTTLSKTATGAVDLSATARIESTATADALATSGTDAAAADTLSAATALPTIDWSQLIVVSDDTATIRRADDAANTAPAALWQEDFVANLGKAARNPNAALRFTI